MLAGPLLFSRYAFMPNHLGYCGGDESHTLLEYGTSGVVDGGLVELERQFEGAYPYLQLIAKANNIPDPLDSRVVQAYWVGNALLDRVDLQNLYLNLRERFRPRLVAKEWRWLESKVPAGARPHHSFHVFEVFPRVGMLRSGAADQLVLSMGQCMVRWGRVVADLNGELIVDAPRLELAEGKLRLTELRRENVSRLHDGRGFVNDACEGDWVAIHWGWACDILTPAQQERLERYTRANLAMCNETF